jgi:streptogramin lyase
LRVDSWILSIVLTSGAPASRLEADDSIGRITPAGVVTNYTSKAVVSPFGIAEGHDRSMWFTNDDTTKSSIDKITTSKSR